MQGEYPIAANLRGTMGLDKGEGQKVDSVQSLQEPVRRGAWDGA